MLNLRSIGAVLIAAALVCCVIAIDFYYTAVANSRAFAEKIEGLEVESVRIPLETKVAAMAAVTLCIAGVRCWLMFRKQNRTPSHATGLLQDAPKL